jgi:hypothetical protein
MKKTRQSCVAVFKGEEGSVLMLTTIGIVVSIGLVGLAMDGGAMYVTKEKAQAAADAAAQAGVMDMYRGTSPSGGTYGSHHTCITNDSWAPCWYAEKNGFSTGGFSDQVTIDFAGPGVSGGKTVAWCQATGVSLSGDSVNLICVQVQRTLNTMLMPVFGYNTSTVTARAIAAITITPSPVPILVTHPTLAGALSTHGTPNITICGGPQRSIQVNSTGSGSASVSINSNTTIDLSRAGPSDPNGTCSGTGADFANNGPAVSYSSWLTPFGSTEHYVNPVSPLQDPLAGVSAPPVPSTVNPATIPLANGQNGCPASPKKACVLFLPGEYTSGINVKNETAVFEPGIYYITSGGFSNDANGDIYMATGFTDPNTGTGWTGNILVYNTGGGAFNVGANSSANLVGSPANSAYKGILFFQDRSTTGVVANTLGGGGALSLQGTLYMNNSNPTSSSYESISLSGHSGNITLIQGEIITNVLSMGGNASIQMDLQGSKYPLRQVALVQ